MKIFEKSLRLLWISLHQTANTSPRNNNNNLTCQKWSGAVFVFSRDDDDGSEKSSTHKREGKNAAKWNFFSPRSISSHICVFLVQFQPVWNVTKGVDYGLLSRSVHRGREAVISEHKCVLTWLGFGERKCPPLTPIPPVVCLPGPANPVSFRKSVLCVQMVVSVAPPGVVAPSVT